jgi:hypothetical protein
MFSWGNLIIYFEMPAWLTDFTDSLVEKPDDEPEVKALKRFLKRNDEYRNERLKCIPSLVAGPLAIKILAPPKREVALHGTVIPLSWKFHDADDQYELPAKAASSAAAVCHDDDNDDDDDDDGSNSSSNTFHKKLCPALECELDCLSGRTIRGMSGIIKRNLSSLVLDIALVIGAQPDDGNDDNDDDDDDNLHACLGMCRFNRIDIASCPEFPARSMYQDVVVKNPVLIISRHDVDMKNHLESSSHRRDILMASRIVGLDSDELKKILAEE